MSSRSEILLDATTHYSTLGLSSDATDNDIHKSYMKLARLLHPDKTKSDATGEQFKLISHAHYVLMDKDQRVKYDETLHSRGLLHYFPKEKYHRYVKITQKDDKSAKQAQKTSRTANLHKPYEQQPYGFGTETSGKSHSHPKVPIFQSFNLKNYQRKQRSAQERTTEDEPTPSNPFMQQSDGGAVDDTLKDQNSTPSSLADKSVGRERTERFVQEAESIDGSKRQSKPKETRDEDIEEENVRWKIHRADTSNNADGTPDSPFSDSQHRHYARKKRETKLRDRRSTSPIKSVPTTEPPGMSESWNGLKNILDNFSSKETKPEGLNENTTLKTEDVLKPPLKASTRVRKSDSLRLDDLSSSLPPNDDFFDMQRVSDILDDVPTLKRAKRATDSGENHDIEMSPPKSQVSRPRAKLPALSSHLSETLHMPVNQPLPKIYKTDIIALEELKLNPQAIQWQLPTMPIFQCNLLDSNEVEQCKQAVIEFNTKCNELKQNLLGVMNERLRADQQLDQRFLKIENAANWASCKDFDIEIVSKLGELQNRQRIVAQSLASLLKSVYATGP